MRFNKTTLDNGLRIVTVPMEDNPSVTILVMVEAGSKYETKEKNGLSHFLEHMVFKGTPKRPKAIDISRELDGIGAHYNAFTSQEFTGYYAKAAAHHFPKILDVVSDMYLNPLFDEKEIAKEKGVIVEEIRMYQDLPQHHVQDIMQELLNGDQPAGWNVAGTEANVRSFGREDFVSYRSKHYVSSATTVIVAGSFDERTAIGDISRAFSAISTGEKEDKLPVREIQSKPAVKVEFKETDQTHIVLSVRSFPILDPRMPIMHVLSTLLGRGMSSRLFSKMRDELGICYYIKADNDSLTDHGAFSISAGVDNSRVDEALKGIISECVRLKEELVGEEEMRKVKDHIAGTTLLDLETSDSRAEYCGYQEALKKKIQTPEEAVAKIEAVTASDVQRLAQEIFKDSGLNLAMIGRYKDGQAFLPRLKF